MCKLRFNCLPQVRLVQHLKVANVISKCWLVIGSKIVNMAVCAASISVQSGIFHSPEQELLDIFNGTVVPQI